jgi:hypothetical protein
MSKEQQGLLDEVYRKYADSHKYFVDGWLHVIPMYHSKETFVNECKTDTEFSEKWGLKIEERELSRLERINVAIEKKLTHKTAHLTKDFDYQKWCDEENIPTKLITTTYNDKTITSYE